MNTRNSLARCLTVLALAWGAASVHAEEAACDSPVDMVIVSLVEDVARYEAYRASLIEEGTLENFGGSVVAVGTRLDAEPELLEGNWPANRHVFVVRWPCAGAAHAFWHSEIYQTRHLPLRVGAGQFNVALFPAVSG